MREGNNFSTPNTHVFFNGLGTIYHGEGEGRGRGGGGEGEGEGEEGVYRRFWQFHNTKFT